jgi:cellulose synthase/poly-beta-1,6-N-acetylglucosamine synthase-like glycosyltransferase
VRTGAELEPSIIVGSVIPTVTAIIPAHNAEPTLGRVLASLVEQTPPVDEVIVVDDASTDRTAEIAKDFGVRVVRTARQGYAGGARNAGLDVATGDVVVFLDADVIPGPGWSAGLERALREFPGAIVGCARTFAAVTPWEWVAHLQVETPYLPRGEPRDVRFVSSFCMAVPRDLPIRWDESYGGEDAIFCIDALAAGARLVFDPRFHALHDHRRGTFADLRRQQTRLAYGLARCGAVQREGLHKRVASRLPLHYFALVRLPLVYRRIHGDPALRRRFLRLLPRLIVAEWTLGLSALRYAVRRPVLRAPTGGAAS